MRFVLALGVLAAVSACGPASSDADTKAVTTTTLPAAAAPAQDFSKPVAVAFAGGHVDTPAGALAPGSIVLATAATIPTEFATVAAASAAVAVTAKDAAGAVLTKAQAPFTLALDVNATALALDGVDKVATNLCALAKAADGQLLVWRNAAIALGADGKGVSFASLWFGTFQLAYCGDAAIAGALDVVKSGDATVGATATTGTPKDGATTVPAAPNAVGKICDLNSGDTKLGVCLAWWGQMYANNAQGQTASCNASKGTLADGNCPAAGQLGVCVQFKGTKLEQATHYYADGSTPYTAESAAAVCPNDTGTWIAGTAYVPTPVADQTDYAPSTTAGPSTSEPGPSTTTPPGNMTPVGACDNSGEPGADAICKVFVGSGYAAAAGTLQAACTAPATWTLGGTCPPGTAVCKRNVGQSNESHFFFYGDPATNAAAKADCQDQGQTWVDTL